MDYFDYDDIDFDESSMIQYLMGVDVGSPHCPWENEIYMNESANQENYYDEFDY
jgi:hypothetical protein